MSIHQDQEQLGFDSLLQEAESDNQMRAFEQATAHLPDTMETAIPVFRGLIDQNHAAMFAGDAEESRRLHSEARRLALKLNQGAPGILADDTAPGNVLARETGSEPGTVPLWGQEGAFAIEAAGMAVKIEMQGLFGIGSGIGFWPGFAARAVDLTRPFLSETGYRSFLGIHADILPNHTPDSFAAMIIGAYVDRELRGKLLRVSERWRR